LDKNKTEREVLVMVKKILTVMIVVMVVIFFMMENRAQSVEVSGGVTELTFTTTVPDVSGLGRSQKAWIEKCEKDAGGKLKIVPYWSNSLFKPREIFRGALDGQADLVYWVPVIELGLMPLNTITWLPMMGWPSEWAQSTIYPQLLEKFSQLKAEYRGLMIYGISSITPGHINTLGKEVRVPSDLKGMKITPATPEIAKMVMAVGGAPVNLVVSDWYTSLERGVTEGFINSFGALMAFKCMELLKYHALAVPGGFGMNPHFLLINPDNWKKIPPDIQKVLKDNEAFYTESCINGVVGEEQWALGYAKKNGHTIVKLTPAEVKLWQDLAQPVHDQWLSKNEDKGAREIYAEAKRLISEYKGR
jgi:TRAP-type C4-dicarboxylate transport system substrate-binding protein